MYTISSARAIPVQKHPGGEPGHTPARSRTGDAGTEQRARTGNGPRRIRVGVDSVRVDPGICLYLCITQVPQVRSPTTATVRLTSTIYVTTVPAIVRSAPRQRHPRSLEKFVFCLAPDRTLYLSTGMRWLVRLV